MENKRIWLSSPHMGSNEIEYVKRVFESNWIAPVGPEIISFEEKVSEFLDDRHVAALSSGTSAIHLALILLGVELGDDVICSSFTFTASANPILYQHASPIFIDSEIDTWNMCPNYLEKAIQAGIEKGNKAKAIILAHIYGMPAKMREIQDISKKYNIPLVEDAAESLGSCYFDKKLGTFGDFSICSFNGNKIITTSGGGALVSSNPHDIEKAKFLSTQARDNHIHYEHSHLGYNYRLSNVSAAIGVGQMEVLEDRIKRKRDIFNIYQSELSHLKQLSFLEEEKGFFSNRWLTTILIDDNSNVNREDLRVHLDANNIESRPLWKPLHTQPIFKDSKYYGDNISDMLFERGLCLPSGTNMSDEDIDRVITNIKDCFEK